MNMKKTGLFFIITAILIAPPAGSTAKKGTLHFFKSAVCPACKRATQEMPLFKKKYPGLRVKTYMVRNKQNRVTPQNRRNIQRLIALLKGIDRRQGGKPFIIESRKAYRLRVERGVPYYMKKISSYTTIKKEVPIPVFILGDHAYAGYRRHVLSRALRQYFR